MWHSQLHWRRVPPERLRGDLHRARRLPSHLRPVLQDHSCSHSRCILARQGLSHPQSHPATWTGSATPLSQKAWIQRPLKELRGSQGPCTHPRLSSSVAVLPINSAPACIRISTALAADVETAAASECLDGLPAKSNLQARGQFLVRMTSGASRALGALSESLFRQEVVAHNDDTTSRSPARSCCLSEATTLGIARPFSRRETAPAGFFRIFPSVLRYKRGHCWFSRTLHLDCL